jgi:itaconate CoA-transferase
MSHAKPLAGLLVVSLEQAVAAPMASRRLADAGARVIKLERPEGDFARGYDKVVHGQSSYFVWLNRGKESVLVDMTKRCDLDLFEALLAKADVFIQNLKPGSLARLGYSFERLRQRFPKLIICSISGYGETGPYAARKAYDLLIQTEAGLAAVTGGPEAPGRVGVSIVDLSTGNNAYAAILEALIGRGITGQGCDIRVSMFDTVAEWMAVPLLHAEAGNPPKRVGLAHPSIAPYGTFRTRDGDDILISIQSEREWVVLVREVLKRPEMLDDARFANGSARVANRTETDRIVGECFASHATPAMIDLLNKADIAYGRVSDFDTLLAHPHLRRMTVETPKGPVLLPESAAQIKDEPRTYGPIPALGAHDAAVRGEFIGRTTPKY